MGLRFRETVLAHYPPERDDWEWVLQQVNLRKLGGRPLGDSHGVTETTMTGE